MILRSKPNPKQTRDAFGESCVLNDASLDVKFNL